VTTEWRILQPARLAVLDGRASDRLARFPGLTTALTAKVIARARATAMMTAIVQQPRVALRVELLFWLLADRWGRVRSDGILLRLPLSHAVISELVAARRPSVTVALGNLIDRGLLVRHPDGFLLRGEPPQLTV
jgi:CRP-like cAMP-binding protein